MSLGIRKKAQLPSIQAPRLSYYMTLTLLILFIKTLNLTAGIWKYNVSDLVINTVEIYD